MRFDRILLHHFLFLFLVDLRRKKWKDKRIELRNVFLFFFFLSFYKILLDYLTTKRLCMTIHSFVEVEKNKTTNITLYSYFSLERWLGRNVMISYDLKKKKKTKVRKYLLGNFGKRKMPRAMFQTMEGLLDSLQQKWQTSGEYFDQ